MPHFSVCLPRVLFIFIRINDYIISLYNIVRCVYNILYYMSECAFACVRSEAGPPRCSITSRAAGFAARLSRILYFIYDLIIYIYIYTISRVVVSSLPATQKVLLHTHTSSHVFTCACVRACVCVKQTKEQSSEDFN